MTRRTAKLLIAVPLVLALIAGAAMLVRSTLSANRLHLTAYFDNSNGIFPATRSGSSASRSARSSPSSRSRRA